MTEYGVQAAAFSDQIHVGRVNKDRTLFLDKVDGTNMVLGAVASWTEQHYDGSVRVTLGGKHIEITVTAVPPLGSGDRS